MARSTEESQVPNAPANVRYRERRTSVGSRAHSERCKHFALRFLSEIFEILVDFFSEESSQTELFSTKVSTASQKFGFLSEIPEIPCIGEAGGISGI